MLQSMFGNYSGYNSGRTTQPWQAPQTDQRKTINSVTPTVTGTQTSTVANANPTSGFNGTAPELDWATFEQHLLNPYLQQGWLSGDDNRGQWAQQLGLDVGGKPTLKVGDLDWASFNQGAMAPNLDDMGLPSYLSNPNAAADREAAYRAALANPDTIYTLGTDRIGAGGTNAGGGRTRSEVQYRRVGDKLVPVNQRDFDKGSLTQDAIKGGLTLAAIVSGLSYLPGMEGAALSGVEGLSGMDLAADAALGSGNNILTAGAGLGEAAGAASAAGGTSNLYSLGGGEVGGSGTLIPGTGTTGLQATAGPGTSLFTPTAQGAGLTVPGLTAAGGTGAMDVLKGLGKALIGGQAGGISALGNLASLFTNYKQYSNTGDLIDEIKGIYSPDGVYAKELEKQLARRDAAAGRNSQYGPRLAELMARLGDSQARSLGGLGDMMQTQQGGLNGMVGSGSRLLDGLGGLEKLFSIFGD